MESIDHFKNLLRFNTANPPGNEMVAISYLNEVLKKEGYDPFIQETATHRGNLVVRFKGTGEQKPLLISSHVDVVGVERDQWTHDPFGAVEEDGVIYGRGAIDMKNFTAMCLMTMLKAKREGWRPKRDLIMSAVSDEECGGNWGMWKLVGEHPELIKDAEFALGEVGAYTLWVDGKPIYPIQAGEKGTLWLEVIFQGEPGHGSLPRKENALWKAGRFLEKLERAPFKYRPTESFRQFSKGLGLGILATPLGPKILRAKVKGGNRQTAGLLAMCTVTANPTGIEGGLGGNHNVIPSAVKLKLDCRRPPGVSESEVIQELESFWGEPLEYRVISSHDGHESPINTEPFRIMKKNLEQGHPGAKALPWLTIGYTDASALSTLGITCYGFTPVKLPQNLDFIKLYHGHNECIPTEGFLWGVDVLEKTVKEIIGAD